MKRAVITGVTGQDGSYLADLLLSKGYEVHGLVRQSTQFTPDRWGHLRGAMQHSSFHIHHGDVTDATGMRTLIDEIQPDEVYNLAAQSHVGQSFEQPINTVNVTALGPLNMLEAIRRSGSKARFYEASSSEMFGKVQETPQSEKTRFYPRSPYGCAKAFGHYITQNYREAYGIFACSGVLFNHETAVGYMPIMFKEGTHGEIDIKPIAEVVKYHTNAGKISINETLTMYQGTDVSTELYVHDFEGWTRVKFASGYPHQPTTEHKHPRVIVAKRGVFTATSSHQIIMNDASEKDVGHIEPGDHVHIATYPRQQIERSMSTDEARLIGFIVGDGRTKGRNGVLTGKDKQLLEGYASTWTSMDPAHVVEFWLGSSGFTGRQDIWHAQLKGGGTYFKTLDVYNESRKKRVPKRILNGSLDVQRAFLEGYNDADGLKANPAMRSHFKAFKTNSATLAAGITYLLTRVTGQRFNLNVYVPTSESVTTSIIYDIGVQSNSPRSQDSVRNLRNQILKLKARGLTHVEVADQLGCSIAQVKARNMSVGPHHLEKPDTLVKKVIDLNDYSGWFYDLETESNTFVCGVGLMHVHNSPRRGEQFVTRKITRAVGRIKHGLQAELVLGPTSVKRDWGYAPDYVEAMWRMLQQPTPRDYVIGTGECHTVQEFVDAAFSYAGLDPSEHVKTDPQFTRPSEVDTLRADPTRALNDMGWYPTVAFFDLVKRMVDHDMKLALAEAANK